MKIPFQESPGNAEVVNTNETKIITNKISLSLNKATYVSSQPCRKITLRILMWVSVTFASTMCFVVLVFALISCRIRRLRVADRFHPSRWWVAADHDPYKIEGCRQDHKTGKANEIVTRYINNNCKQLNDYIQRMLLTDDDSISASSSKTSV